MPRSATNKISQRGQRDHRIGFGDECAGGAGCSPWRQRVSRQGCVHETVVAGQIIKIARIDRAVLVEISVVPNRSRQSKVRDELIHIKRIDRSVAVIIAGQ